MNEKLVVEHREFHLKSRHPTHTLKIDFCPIVQIPCTGMHHEAALEMCGNSTDAAKRNEQQADLATVSVTVVQHIFRDILNGGIFACRSPREVVIHPTEDTFGFQVGVGFTGCQFGSKFAQAWGKDDMLLTLGSIFLIKGGRRIIGLHISRAAS